MKILEKEGKGELLKGAKIHMNGSPANMKAMKNFAEEHGVAFTYTVNKWEPVGMLGGNVSNSQNKGHTGSGNNAKKGYNKYQEFNPDLKKYETSIGDDEDKKTGREKYSNTDIRLIGDNKILNHKDDKEKEKE